ASITLQVVGGKAPYVFAWSNPAGFTSNLQSINGLKAGDYNLTITDANGCQVSQSYKVNEEICCDITATASAPDILCDATTGTITAVATNGWGNYRNSLDNGTTYQTGNTFTGKPAGTYSVKVIDANNCSTEAPVTIVQIIPTLVATATAPDILCDQN